MYSFNNPLTILLLIISTNSSLIFSSLLFTLHIFENKSAAKHFSVHCLYNDISYGALIGQSITHLSSYKYLYVSSFAQFSMHCFFSSINNL